MARPTKFRPMGSILGSRASTSTRQKVVFGTGTRMAHWPTPEGSDRTNSTGFVIGDNDRFQLPGSGRGFMSGAGLANCLRTAAIIGLRNTLIVMEDDKSHMEQMRRFLHD